MKIIRRQYLFSICKLKLLSSQNERIERHFKSRGRALSDEPLFPLGRGEIFGTRVCLRRGGAKLLAGFFTDTVTQSDVMEWAEDGLV